MPIAESAWRKDCTCLASFVHGSHHDQATTESGTSFKNGFYQKKKAPP